MEKLCVQWAYTPADYFPSEVKISTEKASITISDGKIVANINSPDENLNEALVAAILASVEDVFIAHQLTSFKQFNIEGYSIQRESADGKKDIIVSLQSAVLTFSGEAHTKLMDSSGKVLKDSKMDQIEWAKQIAVSVSIRNRDSLANWIIERFQTVIADKNNELVYYYEILDALKNKFGGIQSACSNLGMTKKAWKRIGFLANKAPLLEGRHRGQHFGHLRKASSSEIAEARQIIKDIIFRYLDFAK